MQVKIPRISKRHTIIFISLFIALLTSIPQIWAYIKTPDGYFFTGAKVNYNLNDIEGVYFSAIRNFSEGDILYRNPYDSSQAPFFHYPVYLALGKIVALTGFSVEFVYHLAAFLLTFAFSIFIFKFLSIFFVDFTRRVFAFFLVCFGGLYALGVPEGVGLFSFTIPHFVANQLVLFTNLYILILLSTKKEVTRNKFYLATLFLANLTVSMIHPWMGILLVIFYLFLTIYKILKKEFMSDFLWPGLILMITNIPFVIYFRKHIPWASFELETGILLLPLLYGILLAVAIFGLVKVLKRFGEKRFLFLAVWFFIQIIFIYLPFPFQRRFIEGLYFPLAVFAVVGIDQIINHFRIEKSRLLVYNQAVLYLCIGVFANYLIINFALPDEFFYKKNEERDAVKYLDLNENSNVIVLSSPLSGDFIASQASVKIFLGHRLQTPDFETKNQTVDEFLMGSLNEERRKKLLLEKKICFVYIGPEEKKIARIDFAEEEYLENFYSNSEVTIYKVKQCENGQVSS